MKKGDEEGNKVGKKIGFQGNLHLIALQGKLELEFAKMQTKGKF